MTTLTTADIMRFAANRLARFRQMAHGRVEQAKRLAGSTEALLCARIVSNLLDQSNDVHLLAQLVGEHGDSDGELAIEADLCSTQSTLISQAQLCRLSSIPRSTPIPIPEVTDTDFGAFQRAQQH
jgi:hypothetical protein